MTRKQTLYTEVLKLRNQIAETEGNTDRIINIEEYATTWDFHYKASDYKVYELEEEIKSLQSRLERVTKEKHIREAREAYYATPAGQEMKADLERWIEKTRADWDKYEVDSKAELNGKIEALLGQPWGVSRLSTNCICIGVRDTKDESKRDFIFGQEFEIFYEQRSWYGRENRQRFEANIGTCGSFSAIDGEAGSFARYYIGIGQLLSNTEFLSELKHRLFKYAADIEDFYKTIKDLEKQLENPVGIEE